MEEIQSLISNANTSNIQLVIGLDELKELCSYFVKQEFDRQEKIKEQENDGLLDSKQVMELLNVKYETLWRWSKSGYLPCVKIGCRNNYRREDVEEILGKREKNDED
jgi:predicted DNA-binding transcriptional regulator AlpA